MPGASGVQPLLSPAILFPGSGLARCPIRRDEKSQSRRSSRARKYSPHASTEIAVKPIANAFSLLSNAEKTYPHTNSMSDCHIRGDRQNVKIGFNRPVSWLLAHIPCQVNSRRKRNLFSCRQQASGVCNESKLRADMNKSGEQRVEQPKRRHQHANAIYDEGAIKVLQDNPAALSSNAERLDKLGQVVPDKHDIAGFSGDIRS
jgi:hypothetical protein